MSASRNPGSPDWLRAMAKCNYRCEDYGDAVGLQTAAERIEQLERENAALRHSEENLASTVRGLEFENEKLQRENAALREALDAARKEGGAS